MEFGTDEDKVNPKRFIPRLFSQVGDKTNGWHSKTNTISLENFQTKLDLVWNLFPPQIRHKKFPNQTGFGLEICDNIFSFQTKLGLVWKIVTTFLESLFQTKLDLVWKRTLFKM